jgi:hypothetical protein
MAVILRPLRVSLSVEAAPDYQPVLLQSENYASEAIAHRWGKQLGKIPRSL